MANNPNSSVADRVPEGSDTSKQDEILSLIDDPDTLVAVHTKLERELQLEAGKASHSRMITIVALGFLAVIVAYNIVNVLFLKNNVIMLAAFSLGPCIFLFIGAFWGYQPIILIKGQKQFNQNGRWPEYLIRLTSNAVINYSLVSGKTYIHSYETIRAVKETPNLVTLLTKDAVIPLEKSGLVKGSLEDLRILLDQKVKA